jgi:transcription initiation factor TFIID TATA-box-binding protein
LKRSLHINGSVIIEWKTLENITSIYNEVYKEPRMPQTKPMISVVNVVASASVDQKMDLNEITKKFPETEYNPEQFPGLVFRLTKPKTATLIFRTGKMVCTGAKSEELAILAVNTVVQKLRKAKIKIKKDAIISVQNIVSSINLGGKIHLEKSARTLPRSMYEPEQFPGLIHRMLDPKTVILVFASGKLVCTGAKKETEVYRSVHNLHSLLEEKNLMIYD